MKNYEILQKLRKRSGLSAKEVGNLLNVGQTTISSWEIGRNEPPVDMLIKLAKIYNVSLDYLILGEENGILITKQEYEILMQCKNVLSDLQARHEITIKNSNNTIIGNSGNISIGDSDKK